MKQGISSLKLHNFASLSSIPTRITSSAVGLKICVIAAGIKAIGQ